MKQGRADSSRVGSTKIEPQSRGVNPGGAAGIGLASGGRSTPLYEGRGLKAPVARCTIHPKGSQRSR